MVESISVAHVRSIGSEIQLRIGVARDAARNTGYAHRCRDAEQWFRLDSHLQRIYRELELRSRTVLALMVTDHVA